MTKKVLALLAEQPDLSNIKLIGDGAFTSVYKVVQTSSKGKRKQVVRVISDISDYHAIQREKKLLNFQNNYAEFIHFNEIRKVGKYYLQFFDFVGKKNLKQSVTKRGPLSNKSTRSLLKDMVKILERIHAVGFVHGDIKPTNIVVGKKQCYLIDWSNSIPFVSSFDSETMTGDKKYCPPERLNGILNQKSDIYSLGCTLYFALTGRHIFQLDKNDNLGEQLWAQVYRFPHKLDSLSTSWRYLIQWMTHKQPDKRPTLAELDRWLTDKSIPNWVKEIDITLNRSFPKNPLNSLAEENYLYPKFKQALDAEEEDDLELAFNLYEYCANQGYSRAANNLGLLHEHGKLGKPSYALAASYYDQAFKKANPFAAYNLARFFQYGKGIAVNLESAFKLYKFAALRGNIKAQNCLGLMLLKGQGTNQDIKQARSWFILAANSGSKEAMENLLRMKN